MIKDFYFTTEDNKNGKVIFTITRTENTERCYGIKTDLYVDEALIESETVNSRFFTLCETEQVIEMLCKYEVMPGTVADVI